MIELFWSFQYYLPTALTFMCILYYRSFLRVPEKRKWIHICLFFYGLFSVILKLVVTILTGTADPMDCINLVLTGFLFGFILGDFKRKKINNP